VPSGFTATAGMYWSDVPRSESTRTGADQVSPLSVDVVRYTLAASVPGGSSL
jgi:hypothetical protein